MGLGELMGEAGMTAIMEQAGKTGDLVDIIQGREVFHRNILQAPLAPVRQMGGHHGAEHPPAGMHGADAMQEAGVSGSRKNQGQDIVLTDKAQELEQRVVNDLYFMAVQDDTAMHRIHDQAKI